MASYIARNGTFYDFDLLKQTLSTLNEQRNSSQFCDVVLKVSGTQIFAHSNVLAAASPYFGSFLGTGTDCPRMFSQKHPQIIEIHIDTKEGDSGYGDAVCKVVEFMYTSQITLTTDLVFQIIQIGKIMQMDKLLQFCEYFQSGENNNCPRDMATCTTGLQEIADLLGSRSKTLKRADAFTMTESSLFLKVANHNNELSSSCQTLPCTSTDNDNFERRNIIVKEETMDEKFNFTDVKTVGFESLTIDQNDASLLLEISNVRLPYKNDNFSKPDNNFTEILLDNNKESDNTNSQVTSSVENLSGVQLLTDMISAAASKSRQDPENVNILHTTRLKFPTEQQFILSRQTHKDINLEEISDLVKFDPVTTAMLQTTQSWSRGRGRGRGRGVRGRLKKKPGRPRKIKEMPESDPEFEEFIDKLERGDTVTSSEVENMNESEVHEESTANEEMDLDEGDIDMKSQVKSQNVLKSWKSRRSRSKPLVLKKDYIMHSLTKKSRRQKEMLKLSSTVVKSQQDELKTVEASKINFVCQKCDFSSPLFKIYRQHLKSHPETDPRYFVCDKCNFKTTKSREFTGHKQKHMVEELICSYCEHQSETSEEFLEHVKKHEGVYPYFCSECDSRFKTKNQLIAHKPKHQLEKPFVCAICKSGFKWKHALKNHMITHSATKDHLCDVCGYATAHKSQLKAHKLIHTGHMFKCPVMGCHFEATKRQNLKYHMVTHTHEKPHQCEVCGQSFSLIKNMRRHMLLHTDTRPFSCKICSFSTTRYDKLKEHNHKLHMIGEAPVFKREIADEAVTLLNSNVTYVSTDGITINSDGGITEETLQTIAQLASAQSLSSIELQGTTINIEQTAEDGTVYPIIATVQSYTDNNGEVQYIAEIPQ